MLTVRVLGGSCDDEWHYYNGNCFYVSISKTWLLFALIGCGAEDAELVSISDQKEMEFVESIS